MGERAHQFRSVQKRLLVKFKDKNPQPLQHLDLLLDDTCQQLNALSVTVDEAQVPTHTPYLCFSARFCGSAEWL